MWPNPLRLASPEHGDKGKVGGQPTQQDANRPPVHKNPEPCNTEKALETPTPEKPTAEGAEKIPTPGEHILVCLQYTCLALIACPGQSAHHEEKPEPPPARLIDSADVNRHRQDPGDPPESEGQRH